jgi:hypothetical protein
VPDDFVSNVFWCAVTSIGQSNHRLVRKFKLFPWRLAVVSDSNSEESVKTKAATDFLTLNDCCLCEGFGQPLRELVGQDCVATDFLHGGKWALLIKAAFQGLPHNISVENCFARLKNMQQTGRGRSNLVHNLAAKHLLSEVKCSHLTGMQVHEQMSVHGNASSMAIGGQPEGQVNQAIVPADPRTTDSEGLGS